MSTERDRPIRRGGRYEGHGPFTPTPHPLP